MISSLKNFIENAITGLDAIKRAPIVNKITKLKCLRIQDISQLKDNKSWGYTSADINNVKNFLIKKDDLFIARTGNTIGCNFFAMKNFDSVFNNGLIRIRVNCHMNPQYLSYVFQTKKFRIFVKNIGRGSSTQPNIKIKDLLNYKFNVHKLEEQQHIVNTIGSIDDLIENLKNQNKRLIKIGLSKINNLNENKTKNLLEIVNFVRGKEIGSLNYKHSKKDNMINYLRVADLLSLGNTYVNKDKKLNIAQFNDILCAFDGTPGRNNIGLLGAYCSGIYNLKCKEIDKGLVYFEINSDLNQKIIRMFSRGTTILHASKAINFLQYVEVSLEEKQSLNILFKKIVQNKKKIECLKFAKHNLLNKFF
ncbi:restriction endonuclease subunit S [Metamycoplasma hominis]|uniref:restriction endonuclease subunit S n=1 Tax=Metamycoplasma hominis TaxID=2098 RepID=UPI00397DCC64